LPGRSNNIRHTGRITLSFFLHPSTDDTIQRGTTIQGPENNAEYVFSNICLTLALLTNAVIIGSATNLLSNMDAAAVAKKTQLDGVNGYMRFKKVRALKYAAPKRVSCE